MTLPRVQPIAPTWRKDPFDHPEWLFDVKYDGFRAVAYIEQRRSRLISRNHNVMTRFDVLAEQVAATLDIDDAVLDGEIICSDGSGRPQFYDLLRGTRAPCYIASPRLPIGRNVPREIAEQEVRLAAAASAAKEQLVAPCRLYGRELRAGLRLPSASHLRHIKALAKHLKFRD